MQIHVPNIFLKKDDLSLWKKWMKFLEKEKHNFHPYR
jgi:hypothetical protein